MNYTLTSSIDSSTTQNPDRSFIERKLAALQDGDFIILGRDDPAANFMQAMCEMPKGTSTGERNFILEYTEGDSVTTRKQYSLDGGASTQVAAESFAQFMTTSEASETKTADAKSGYATLPRQLVPVESNDDDDVDHKMINRMVALTIVFTFLVIAFFAMTQSH